MPEQQTYLVERLDGTITFVIPKKIKKKIQECNCTRKNCPNCDNNECYRCKYCDKDK